MTIPDFQTIMLPMLQLASDNKEHSVRDFVNALARHFALTEEERNELLPSGKQAKFYNRVGWARTFLTKSGLLEMSRRSVYRITPRGQQVLAGKPKRVDMKFLEQFPEYIEFREKSGTASKPQDTALKTGYGQLTPDEVLVTAYQEIRSSLALELLALVKQNSPTFLEHLVVELLVRMGYGGSYQEAARAVGQTGDDGIDGVIDEDRLGLDSIYVQAKKWEHVVGRPEIQKFVGALMGKRARKGIFITTSSFSSEASSYVSSIESKIVLIDGKRLAELMLDYDVGVVSTTTYQLKKIDTDYFSNI